MEKLLVWYLPNNAVRWGISAVRDSPRVFLALLEPLSRRAAFGCGEAFVFGFAFGVAFRLPELPLVLPVFDLFGDGGRDFPPEEVALALLAVRRLRD